MARPGCSEHQTGLAIDLGLNQGEVDFLCPAFPYDGICRPSGTTWPGSASSSAIRRREGGRHRHRPRALALPVRGPAPRPAHGRPGLCHLEEYLPWLAGFPWAAGGLRDAFGRVGFLPRGAAAVEVPETGTWTLSGNNVDGFFLTEWGG